MTRPIIQLVGRVLAVLLRQGSAGAVARLGAELRRNRGSVVAAARALELDPGTLYRIGRVVGPVGAVLRAEGMGRAGAAGLGAVAARRARGRRGARGGAGASTRQLARALSR